MAFADDYYGILGVSSTASAEEIRAAYMREALKVHPDRNQSPGATREFQRLADAYYTLSDAKRRREYDRTRKHRGADTQPQQQAPRDHTSADDVFGDVFEDMLRPEVEGSGSWWSMLGMSSGAVLGFIVGNLPGAVAGGYAGRKLGSIRDKTGRPVYETFQSLPHARKLQILAAIAAQLMAGGAGGPK
ncbi:DnaJ-domain-containing protein [Martensiomyces pterosporus]|nr:DnaJ-domain-containing protein [Martensiomyces pterosporus]